MKLDKLYLDYMTIRAYVVNDIQYAIIYIKIGIIHCGKFDKGKFRRAEQKSTLTMLQKKSL